MFPQWRLLVLLCLCVCMSAAAAPLSSAAREFPNENISEHRLPNGLRILLAPNANAQKIAFNLVYLTGALADRDGGGGRAHLLEHLLFKGTAKLPHGKVASEMTRRGIQYNASTSHDRTRYEAVLPDASELDWMLSMEADRMVNARFSQQDLDLEIPVVLREMEITQSNPTTVLSQALFAIHDPGGYGRNPIGTPNEVEKLTLKTVLSFYKAYYRPDNAIVVISGKFNRAETLASAQQHFGAIHVSTPAFVMPRKPTSTNLTIPSVEPPRELNIKRGNTHLLALAYPIPAADAPVNAEFAVLAEIFSANPDGRLYQALVNQNKAIAVFANPQVMRKRGMFFFASVLAEDQSVLNLQQDMSDIIEQLGRQPITEQELQRAQQTISSAHARLLADPLQLGSAIAEHAALGNWRLLFQHADRVADLSASEVQQAGITYFKSTTRIVAELNPETDTRHTDSAPDVTVPNSN